MSVNEAPVQLLELIEGVPLAGAPASRGAPWRAARRLAMAPPLFARYVLVSGLLGVPASILQLAVMLFVYERQAGEAGVLALNALWLINFELGLLRNYALHCAYTWQVAPTWRSLRHAHVAASGAIVVDIVVFNVLVWATGIIPLAQFFGAGAGFALNFSYNRFLTFSRDRGIKESMT